MDVPEKKLAKPLNGENIIADKLNITSATIPDCQSFKQICLLEFQIFFFPFSFIKKAFIRNRFLKNKRLGFSVSVFPFYEDFSYVMLGCRFNIVCLAPSFASCCQLIKYC